MWLVSMLEGDTLTDTHKEYAKWLQRQRLKCCTCKSNRKGIRKCITVTPDSVGGERGCKGGQRESFKMKGSFKWFREDEKKSARKSRRRRVLQGQCLWAWSWDIHDAAKECTSVSVGRNLSYTLLGMGVIYSLWYLTFGLLSPDLSSKFL